MARARDWSLLAYITARLSALLLLILCLSSFVAAHGGGEGPLDFLKQFSGPFNHTWELWAYSLSSTLLISAAPFFILFFIPLDNAMEHSTLLKVLLSFASGGLLGDAFLHLIPHATSPHDHSHGHTHDHSHGEEGVGHHGDGDHVTGHAHDHTHSHDHMQDMIVGLWVLGGIVTFLIVEKFVRLAKGGGHGHSHGAVAQVPREGAGEGDSAMIVNGGRSEGTVRRRKKDGATSGSNPNTNSIPATPHPTQQGPRDIKVAGYLNLAADFTHNFTDGLAIGASFLAGKSIGLITTLTILFHEVPHEIGDFAILIQSGCPKRKAIMLQLVTAVGALAGTVCGLLAEGVGSSVATSAATAWILPFTAGGFIYIATVSVIPELLEDNSLKQSVMEVLAIFVGIGMMVVIGLLE